MKFTITLVPQDYVDARRLGLRPRKGMRILMYILLAVYALALGGALIDFVRTGHWFNGLGWMSFFPAYALFIYYVLIPWRTRRIFKQQKTLHDPVTFTFTNEGMHAESKRGNANLVWDDFFKWKVNTKTLLLYHSSAVFNMIPARAFPTPEEFLSFQALVESKLGQQKA
jgi:hypothetical protein